MPKESDAEKVARFEAALNQFTERLAEDRYALAVVLVGSLSKETIWRRESLGLWIIEADGVSRRSYVPDLQGCALQTGDAGGEVPRQEHC